jgi:hypothetical protein
LARFNFATDVLGATNSGIDIARLVAQAGLQEAIQKNRYGDIVDFFARLLWQVPPSTEAREALMAYLQSPTLNSNDFVNVKIRGVIHLMLAAPDFQVS